MNVGFYYMANAGGRLVGTLLSGVLYQLAGVARVAVGRGGARRPPPAIGALFLPPVESTASWAAAKGDDTPTITRQIGKSGKRDGGQFARPAASAVVSRAPLKILPTRTPFLYRTALRSSRSAPVATSPVPRGTDGTSQIVPIIIRKMPHPI